MRGFNAQNPYELPPNLPVPKDDGGCDHLPGKNIPHLTLRSTSNRTIDLADACKTESVLFFYPSTGKPGILLPDGWDEIPGARGCTPESCAYRDFFVEFRRAGFSIFGVSSQTPEVQLEFAIRNNMPYEILSDSDLRLATALQLPTFTITPPNPIFPQVCIKRLTIVVTNGGKIEKVFYPVFPPDKNAEEVLAYIQTR